MESFDFYDEERAQLREDFFKKYSLPDEGNNLFFKCINEYLLMNARILDIGTGNGFVLEQLIRKYPKKYFHLEGIDISIDMLKKAKKRIDDLQIKLILGDNIKLPFQSDSFDAVTSKNVTNLSESEIYRVLKTSGKFFFREYGSGKGLKEIADLFQGRLIRARGPDFYISRLEHAGFKNISLKEINIKREYSFEKLLQIIKMFPFLDEVTEKDKYKIKSYFEDKDKILITSDQKIIIGEK